MLKKWWKLKARVTNESEVEINTESESEYEDN